MYHQSGIRLALSPGVSLGCHFSQSTHGDPKMKNKMISICYKVYSILNREEGQDLIEYALVVALIAFAATAGMNTVANDINNAFLKIGSKLTTAIGS
jgi:pilus assembly protein Flp/PilA